MRNHGLTPDDEGDVPFWTTTDSLPVSRRSPEARSDDLESIMSWLRNGCPDSEDPSGDFKRVDEMLPKSKGKSPVDRAREIEGVLDWMRNTGVRPSPDGVIIPFDNLASLPISRRSPEERLTDRDHIATWIRNGRSDSDDPGGEFMKIDQLLASKPGQSALERAQDLEGAL